LSLHGGRIETQCRKGRLGQYLWGEGLDSNLLRSKEKHPNLHMAKKYRCFISKKRPVSFSLREKNASFRLHGGINQLPFGNGGEGFVLNGECVCNKKIPGENTELWSREGEDLVITKKGGDEAYSPS